MEFDHYVKIVKQFAILNNIMGKVTVNPDRSVDVDGSVFLSGLLLTELPLQFGKIDGAFHFQSNDNITTCKGFPREVGASLKIVGNDSLSSLVGFPESVGYSMTIMENESLSHTNENFEALLQCKVKMGEIFIGSPFCDAFNRYKTIKDITS